MKKKLLAILLATAMLGTLSLTAMASDEAEVMEEPLSAFIGSLDDNSYGGAFIDENGQTCIKVPDETAARAALSRMRGINAEDFELQTCEVTLADLKAAQDELLAQQESLHISAIGLTPSNSGLMVFLSPEATDADKAAISETSSIKNIEFKPDSTIFGIESDNASDVDTNNENANVDSADTKEARASSIRGGYYFYRQAKSDPWSSVGYRVKQGSTVGYVTCGHGWSNGQAVYFNGSKVGNITGWQNSGKLDVSFVPDTLNLTWGGLRADGAKASYYGRPMQGDSVIMDGARHYQDGLGRVHATVMCENVSGTWDTTKFSGLFAFNQLPLQGDSGAAILKERSDGTYTIIGINKSQWRDNCNGSTGTVAWGTGVNWVEIKNGLNLTVYK